MSKKGIITIKSSLSTSKRLNNPKLMSPLNERDPRQSDSLLNNDYEANNNNLMRSPTEDGTENDYNTLNSFPSIMDIYPTNNTSKFVLYIRTNLLISTIFWLWALYNTFFTSYSNIGESFDLGTVSFLAVMGSCRGILRELGVGVWRQNSGSGEEVEGMREGVARIERTACTDRYLLTK